MRLGTSIFQLVTWFCRAAVKAEPAVAMHTGRLSDPLPADDEAEDEDEGDDITIADLAALSRNHKLPIKLSPINGAGRGYSHSPGACWNVIT